MVRSSKLTALTPTLVLPRFSERHNWPGAVILVSVLVEAHAAGSGAAILGVSDPQPPHPGTLSVGVEGRGIGNASTFGVYGLADSGPGVWGRSPARGVVGELASDPNAVLSCDGVFAVGGCGGPVGDGVFGQSSVPASSFTAAALHGSNTAGGDIFIGEASGARKARINGDGKGFFNGGTQTGGADYADSLPTSDDPTALEPGDVLAIDPQQGYAVRRSREPNSRLGAGVYSTQPAVLGVGQHGLDDPLTSEVPVALVGVVPTRATTQNGPIEIGDLLVTSSLPGHAMKAQAELINGVAIYPTGAILGKALAPLAEGTGLIRVLITLR